MNGQPGIVTKVEVEDDDEYEGCKKTEWEIKRIKKRIREGKNLLSRFLPQGRL